MIDATVRITVPPEKRKEVLQTFTAILRSIRREDGCISCNCYVDIESDNKILFREEWKNNDHLHTHLRSSHFGVLIGVMKLLNQEPDIRFSTVAPSVGIKEIKAMRT